MQSNKQYYCAIEVMCSVQQQVQIRMAWQALDFKSFSCAVSFLRPFLCCTAVYVELKFLCEILFLKEQEEKEAPCRVHFTAHNLFDRERGE